MRSRRERKRERKEKKKVWKRRKTQNLSCGNVPRVSGGRRGSDPFLTHIPGS